MKKRAVDKDALLAESLMVAEVILSDPFMQFVN